MTEKTVKYRLASSSGYKANIVKLGYHVLDSSGIVDKLERPDVEITRPLVPSDVVEVHNKCLVTANGYIEPTEVYNQRLFVKGLTKKLLISNSNQIGIISFAEMEENLVIKPIEKSYVTSEGSYELYNKAIITFPEPVKEGFLVIAGYMVFENPEFLYRVSDKAFMLRLDRLSYLEKLNELRRYRDIYDELGVEVSVVNPTAAQIQDLMSQETIKNFLSLNNSFYVETPNYSLETKRIYLESSTVPGQFRTELEPVLPFIGGEGKVVEYKCRRRNNSKYTVYTTDAYVNNHLFTKAPLPHPGLINGHRIVGRTHSLSQGFFLEVTLNKIN